MELISLKIEEFIEEMASGSPAPGGGSAAALNGAIGAALSSMVCALTLENNKYADAHDQARQIKEEASALSKELLSCIERDTEAFYSVVDVFGMPKTTEEEKTARKAAMQTALKKCVISPYEIMRLSLQGMELSGKLMENFNTNAASDLGSAVINFKAAIQCAWLNVCINLQGIRDEDFTEEYRNKGLGIINEATALAARLYEMLGASIDIPSGSLL